MCVCVCVCVCVVCVYIYIYIYIYIYVCVCVFCLPFQNDYKTTYIYTIIYIYIYILNIYKNVCMHVFIYLHILDEHIWLSSGGVERLSGGWSVMRFLLHSHQRIWLQSAKIWLERQGSKRLQGPPCCSMIGYSDVQHTCFIFIFKSISNICIGKTEVGTELYLGCSKTLEWKTLKFKFHRFELLWPDLNEY